MMIEKGSPAWKALTSSISANTEGPIELELITTGRGDECIVLQNRMYFATIAAHERHLDRVAQLNLQGR